MVRETNKQKRLDWPLEYLHEAGTNVSTNSAIMTRQGEIKRGKRGNGQTDKRGNGQTGKRTKRTNGNSEYRFETGKRCLSFPVYPF